MAKAADKKRKPPGDRVKWVAGVLTLPLWLISKGFQVRRRNWLAERLLLFVAAAPTLLLPVLVVGLLYYGKSDPVELIARYKQDGAAALKTGKWQQARDSYLRVLQLDPHSEQARFGLAVAEAGRGDLPRAVELMKSLAPPEQPGRAGAHLWLARWYIYREEGENIRAALVHLKRARESNPNHVEAIGLMGIVESRLGAHEKAAELLGKAGEADPLWKIHAARNYDAWRKRLPRKDARRARELEDSAREAAEGALPSLRRIFERKPTIPLLIQVVDAEILVGEHESAAKRLVRWIEEYPTSRIGRHLLARVYFRWAQVITDAPRRVELLINALALSPGRADVLEELIRLSATEPEAKEAIARRVTDGGASAAIVHMLLGLAAWQEGKQEKGLVHLEQSLTVGGRLGAIATNNLAYCLAHADKPDLERALKLIQEVVRKNPAHLRYLDTRGRILARMGRYKEALTDLEKAAPAVRDKAGLYNTMAEVYTRLGMDELARVHRQKAAEIEKRR